MTPAAITRCFALILLCAFGTVAQSTPPDPMQYGRAYLAEGDPVAAIKSYAEALRVNPSDAAALNNMGVAKAAAGDYQSALDFLTRAQRLAPHRDDIQDNLAALQDWARTSTQAGADQTSSTSLIAEPPPLWSQPARQADLTPAGQPNSFCHNASCK